MTPSYALGLFFILCVSLIWSLASIVVQYLYTEHHFDSPFLLTYIGTSLFILLIPMKLGWERRQQCCSSEELRHEMDRHITPWTTDAPNNNLYEHVPLDSNDDFDTEMIQFQQEEKDHPSPGGGTSTLPSAATEDVILHRWSHKQHIHTAMYIAPVWFIANWAYNASLEYTSITSSTVLASTGSLFTFLFAVLQRDESFTWFKLSGVVLGMMGSILTGLHDATASGTPDASGIDNGSSLLANVTMAVSATAGRAGTPHHFSSWSDHDNNRALWGDCLGLVSAVGYGGYAVMIRVLCPHDERRMSMQLLLGYIGLWNAVLLSPLALKVVAFPSAEAAATTLTWVILGYLVAKGLLDNVLSDYLWARAVLLTSATVATVGLGLTIPLAFVSDWCLGRGHVLSWQSIVGALSVLAGFILVNLDPDEEEKRPTEVTTTIDSLPRAEPATHSPNHHAL